MPSSPSTGVFFTKKFSLRKKSSTRTLGYTKEDLDSTTEGQEDDASFKGNGADSSTLSSPNQQIGSENIDQRPPIPPKRNLKQKHSPSTNNRGNGSDKSSHDNGIKPLLQRTLSNILKSSNENKYDCRMPDNKTSAQVATMKKMVKVKYVRVHGEIDGAYKNESEPRGLVFIKNFETFDGTKYENRKGSLVDYCHLVDLFNQMGYKHAKKYCETGHITKEKFMKDIKAFSELNHDIYDSTILIIMSHGAKDKTFVTSDNEEVNLMDVYNLFNNINCCSLKNKPKIFILQFCRPNIDLPMSPSSLQMSQADIEDLVDRRVTIKMELIRREMEADFKLIMATEILKIKMVSDIEEESTIHSQDCLVLPDIRSRNTSVSESLVSQDDIITEPSIGIRRRGSSVATISFVDEQDQCFESELLEKSFAEKSFTDKSVIDRSHIDKSIIDTSILNKSCLSSDSRPMSQSSPHGSYYQLETPPDYSDMYSIFSTNSGGMAYRSDKKGSLLVQAICRVFAANAYQDDIEELVRKVSKHMQQQLQREDPCAANRQTCERVNSGLDKPFYFNPCQSRVRGRNSTAYF